MRIKVRSVVLGVNVFAHETFRWQWETGPWHWAWSKTEGLVRIEGFIVVKCFQAPCIRVAVSWTLGFQNATDLQTEPIRVDEERG